MSPSANRKSASDPAHQALGWPRGQDCAGGFLAAAVRSPGRGMGTGSGLRGLSGPSPLLRPACLPACPASHAKAPLPLSGATRPCTAPGPARAGPEEAGLGSCQYCLGEEVGILSVSVKAGVG